MAKLNRSAVDLITTYNSNRVPEILKFKYDAMAQNPFRFLQGTCHLFYHDYVSVNAVPDDKTRSWICGDMHLENFGAYKGSTGLIYFDINDFDEATKAPVTWDLARFLVSLQISTDTTNLDKNDLNTLSHVFLNKFQEVLRSGKSRTLEQDTVKGVIGDFFRQVDGRSRKSFIESRTEPLKGGGLKLLKNKDHWLKLDKSHSERVLSSIELWNNSQKPESRYVFKDIAYRLAGTGSLGLERYVILAAKNDRYYFLDIKRAQSASITEVLNSGVTWANDAERIIQIETMTQHVSPALLTQLKISGTAYVLQELQPEEDKLDFMSLKAKKDKFSDVITSMAEMAASAYLRSSGWKKSSTIDELVSFAENDHWKKDLFAFSHSYSEQVVTDYKHYMKAYTSGALHESHEALLA